MNKRRTRALMPNHLKQIAASKHSAELTIGTLVVIVLAIIVLVILALGFGAGWSNLWSKITGYFSPVNVDTVKQACVYACTTNSKFDYCCRVRNVRFEKRGKAIAMTCSDNRIKSGDCDLDCNVEEDCSEILCEGESKENCGENEEENPK
jgi:hypothetical protein